MVRPCAFSLWRATLGLLVLIALTESGIGRVDASPRSGTQVWLAVSDIHLNPFDRSARASGFRFDSNVELFESALAQMKRAVPDPSVVLLPGDFFVHHFAERARRGAGGETPDRAGIRTMQQIASAFRRTFPQAQFALAMGNNDAPCGDYHSVDGSAFLKSVARIWLPLVDRRNAAPAFAAVFARDGHYTLELPVRGLRLIVVNSVLFSQEYRGNCGSSGGAASHELSWLQATLRRTPPGTRNVVMMHIPPGFDPFSTQYVHGLVAWPFLRSPYNGMLVDALSERSDHIAFAVVGHTHRFDFRLAGNVPMLVLGSLSPVYGNNPAFYALHVSREGSLRDVDFYAFDELKQMWSAKRSFDATWGLENVDGSSLALLHSRMEIDPALRDTWDDQANGWAPADAVQARSWRTQWWRAQWCAQTVLVSGYAECAHIEGRVTALRALIAAGAVLGVLLVLLAVRAAKRRH